MVSLALIVELKGWLRSKYQIPKIKNTSPRILNVYIFGMGF